MHTIVAESSTHLSALGADLVAATLREHPAATLLVATGNTPMGIYQELAQRTRAGLLDASRARVFQLDEYLGVDEHDDRSLFGWTRRSFVEPLGIPMDRVTRLDATTDDHRAACLAYDAAVAAAGGIDLAIMGLGPNGHLGFNEPPSDADSPSRMVELPEASIQSNSVYWGGRDRVPTHALTAGMPTILNARHIVLVVSGAHKRDILARTLNGPITPDVPASFLQGVPRLTVLADREALPGVLDRVGEHVPSVRRGSPS
ncbi:MAG: glucosamine-6-phosphate deaminase [Thermomicrobiales bacterium]